MPDSEFKPGFRFSIFDALLLVIGTVSALLIWPVASWLAFVIAFVVGHFFLFCNVFRIARGLELSWAALFVILVWLTVAKGCLTWCIANTISIAATIVVVSIELRKPTYHGIGWSWVNPSLRQSWEASMSGIKKTDV